MKMPFKTGMFKEGIPEVPQGSFWNKPVPQTAHVLAKQQSAAFSVLLTWVSYDSDVATLKRTIKTIIKNIYHKQKCPANNIIAHRVSEAMHIQISRALEDPEQRPQGHACGCSGQHAQRQITVIVSIPLTNDDLIGRLLSIKSYKKKEKIVLWGAVCEDQHSLKEMAHSTGNLSE